MHLTLWGGNVTDILSLCNYQFTNLTLWGIAVLGWDISHNVGLMILYVNIMRNLDMHLTLWGGKVNFEFMHLPINKPYIVMTGSIYHRDVS